MAGTGAGVLGVSDHTVAHAAYVQAERVAVSEREGVR